jgi:hypothetical protein
LAGCSELTTLGCEQRLQRLFRLERDDVGHWRAVDIDEREWNAVRVLVKNSSLDHFPKTRRRREKRNINIASVFTNVEHSDQLVMCACMNIRE